VRFENLEKVKGWITTGIPDKKKVRQVLRDVQNFRHIWQLIRRFSSNKKNIRRNAPNQSGGLPRRRQSPVWT